ncbi:LOW QUALITY PROTEIN: little elongation complex subunit 2 [Engraulis encrasicolus]|uniref:LOW QUALITY PROTEIN: little elongation complex subunit 2 n=1 Tax=Engraulis encrasicolus TaxID=184585 RepID=UPI002FCF4A17
MELTWTDSLDTSGPFMTRDAYDKFSLAPTIEELWDMLHSPQKKTGAKDRPAHQSHNATTTLEADSEEDSEGEGDSDQQDEELDDSHENPVEVQGHQDGSPKTIPKGKEPKTAAGGVKQTFPEPRLPYPKTSSIARHEHNSYMQWLLKKGTMPPQNVLQHVRQEVSEFMTYLQEVSRACADDYNYISQGAARYCQEYIKACFDHLKTYPQHYVLQETSNVLGNVYMPNLSLNLEKQLLAMGTIDVGCDIILKKKAQLSVEFEEVNAANPPSKKASESHKPISSDKTAERLSEKYSPDVCLTSEALLQLLDQSSDFTEEWELPSRHTQRPHRYRAQTSLRSGNCLLSSHSTPSQVQSSDFTEEWELPALVTLNALTGKKTVYIDPPLLKRELSVRERNHLFHEETVKMAIRKKNSTPAFFLMTDQNGPKKQLKDSRVKEQAAGPDTGLDFDVDFTELESFGETNLSPKKKPSQDSTQTTKVKMAAADKDAPSASTLTPKREEAAAKEAASTPETSAPPQSATPAAAASTCPENEDNDEDWTDVEDGSVEEGGTSCPDTPTKSPSAVRSVGQSKKGTGGDAWQFATPAKRARSPSECSADSDESQLFIADSPTPSVRTGRPADKTLTPRLTSKSTASTTATASAPAPAPAPSTPKTPRGPPGVPPAPTSPASQATLRATKAGKRPRLEGGCDQLGQILKMQSAMLRATPALSPTDTRSHDPAHRPAAVGPPDTPSHSHSHSHSLVKSCVTSFLEAKEVEDGAASTAPTLSLHLNTSKKCLLEEALRVCVEDEGDYEEPEEGNNALYKLFSLHHMLLLIRSTVALAHARTHPSGSFCVVPVSVLPKLEYQLTYGAECVTSSEACRLWTDTLLNPSTLPHIVRVNAYTSQLVEWERLSPDWLQSISCDFRPPRSLNILHHVLKKVTGLPEGRYLLSHRARAPHFNILRACGDTSPPARNPYDLQAAHAHTHAHAQSTPPAAVVPPPWVPVDPHHLLAIHRCHNRMPCTFPQPIRTQKKGATGYKQHPHQNKGGQQGAPGYKQHHQQNKGGQQGNAQKANRKKNKKRQAQRNKRKRVMENNPAGQAAQEKAD